MTTVLVFPTLSIPLDANPMDLRRGGGATGTDPGKKTQ